MPLTASPAQASRELPGTQDVVLPLIDANFNPVPNVPLRYRVNGSTPGPPIRPSTSARSPTTRGSSSSASTGPRWAGHRPRVADVLGAENGIRESAEPEASARVTWLADNRIGGAPTVPATLSGPNGTLPVGTTPNPDNAEAPTFTFGTRRARAPASRTARSTGAPGAS